MTQTQTTAERIFALIFSNIGYTDGDDRTVASIAAEIDALKAQLAAQDAALVDMPKLAALLATAERERDEARAEMERLRPAAEAFGWWENYASNPSTTTWDIFQDAAQRARDMSFIESRAVILTDDQIDVLKRGIARAREAAKESQP